MASKPSLTVLRRRSDFVALLKFGSRARPADWLVFNYTTNPEGKMRCGWTLPRHVGTAVVRNRLKRWSRVYFRHLLDTGKTHPVDINLVFRKAEGDIYRKLDYETFSRVMDKGWKQIERRLKDISSASSRSVPDDRN